MFGFKRNKEKIDWLIVGLGNIGDKYHQTRHNIGFMVIDYFSQKHNIKLKKKECRGITARTKIEGYNVILCKPFTYMNNSGECIKSLSSKYNIKSENVLVIYDDIDLDLGAVRIRKSGGPGTHNGMKSIIDCIKTKDFPRIRVGIGKPQHGDLIKYVLGKFKKEEQKIIFDSIEASAKSIDDILIYGIDKSMNYNNR